MCLRNKALNNGNYKKSETGLNDPPRLLMVLRKYGNSLEFRDVIPLGSFRRIL